MRPEFVEDHSFGVIIRSLCVKVEKPKLNFSVQAEWDNQVLPR